MTDTAPVARFNPADDPIAFRQALGRFSTGVTVITAMTRDGPVGITANSFTSVSLDPPLILWCPAKAAKRHDLFAEAKHFAVHVLGAHQQGVCDDFARSWGVFSDLEEMQNSEGVPIVPGCLAVFECKTQDIFDAGDHSIILGRVYGASYRDGEPLLFSNGQFSGLPATAGEG